MNITAYTAIDDENTAPIKIQITEWKNVTTGNLNKKSKRKNNRRTIVRSQTTQKWQTHCT